MSMGALKAWLLFGISCALIFAGCGESESRTIPKPAVRRSVVKDAGPVVPGAGENQLEAMVLGGSPFTIGGYEGGIVLASPAEVRFYIPGATPDVPKGVFAAQKFANPLVLMKGTLDVAGITTEPVAIGPSPHNRYLAAFLPAPVHPPISAHIQLQFRGRQEVETTVTLAVVSKTEEDDPPLSERQALDEAFAGLADLLETGVGDKTGIVASMRRVLLLADQRLVQAQDRIQAESALKSFGDAVSSVSAAVERGEGDIDGLIDSVRNDILPRTREAFSH